MRLFVSALAFLLLVAGCSNTADEPEPQSTGPEPAATTTTSAAPTPTSVAATPTLAGIWAEDFRGAILQFRFEAGSGDEIVGVFDSVSEGVTDLAITVDTEASAVTIEIPDAGAVFTGERDGDSISGIWEQAGNEVPMVFERQSEPAVLDRPQNPEPPFPYQATDVSFDNGNISLAGTLIIPDGTGPFPGVVLVSGSGPQDRDETLLGHKPFLVLADALARRGIASVRYDDRGVGGSTGDLVGATTEDLATDAAAAVSFLNAQSSVDAVGMVGHSEGGLIAPIVANGDGAVDFVVLLAGPGLPGSQVLLTQTEELMRAEGAPTAVIEWRMGWNDDVIALAASDLPTAEAATEMRRALGEAATTDTPGTGSLLTEEGIEETVAAFTDPWMRHFLAYDPAPALRSLEVPVLAMIGELDLQVSAADNIPALEEALSGSADATITSLAGLNHLFQHASTGAVSEYAEIEETFDPATMQAIGDWILDRF